MWVHLCQRVSLMPFSAHLSRLLSYFLAHTLGSQKSWWRTVEKHWRPIFYSLFYRMIVGPLHLIWEIQNNDSDSYKNMFIPSSKAVSRILYNNYHLDCIIFVLNCIKLCYNIRYLCAEYLKMYFTQWETSTLQLSLEQSEVFNSWKSLKLCCFLHIERI